MRVRRAVLALLAVTALPAALSAVLTACSTPSGADGPLQIVASTDVYGDIARAVAGPHARITSFIDDPAQDPHSFEASARDQLAISRADIVIENGGGYDDFVDRMHAASGRPGSTVLNAVGLSAGSRSGGEPNEHVWYDLPTVARLAERLAAALGAQDASNRSSFRANAARFTTRIDGLERTERTIRSAHHGDGVAITEPVPLYLLEACGLVNRTPPAFSEAIEAGTDVSAGVLKHTLDLFSTGRVRALVYNAQTSGAETTKVVAAARAHDVAVVPVTESLPAGDDYLSWMASNLDAISRALS